MPRASIAAAFRGALAPPITVAFPLIARIRPPVMRLACPSCAAAYDLPETLFLAGPRMVRCAKCGHSWMASAPEPPAPEPPSEPPAPEPEAPPPAPADAAPGAEAEPAARRPSPLRRRAPAAAAEPPTPLPDFSLAPPEPPRRSAGLAIAWAASLALLLVVGWAGWTRREAVMQAWPASTHLFAALGGLEDR